MTKILITGANGYIGRHVVSYAAKQGLDIVTVDFKNQIPHKGIKAIEIDILKEAGNPDLYNCFGRPDVVLHLAWQDGFNHKADSHINNLPAHYAFLKNMIDAGCSSLAVMGSMHEVGYYEGAISADTPCNPLSLYGIAKNALRQAILTYTEDKNVSVKWLRAFYITGDDEHNNSIFTKILEMAKAGQKTFPFTSGLNKYDFLDVDELAEQVVALSLQKEKTGIINVCSGKPVSLKDKVESFIKQKNLDIQPEYGKFPNRKYDSPAIWGIPVNFNKEREE